MHTCETLGYDREKMFPNYHQSVMEGRALLQRGGVIEAAQDRVCMRRHLRRKHKDVLGSIADRLADMNEQELSDLINAIESPT